mgnify:CR=1 FL=1
MRLINNISLLYVFLILFLPGIGFAQDFNKGMEAARSGDYNAALTEWMPLVEAGDADAQWALGYLYKSGMGVPLNYAEAVRLFRLSAKQGHSAAINSLGTMYSNGWGIDKNKTEGIKLYQKSAEMGNPSAQQNLARSYYDGDGVSKNNNEAFYWWKEAAQQGHKYAQYNLGQLYFKGEGTVQNYLLSHMWTNISARHSSRARTFREKLNKELSETQIAKAQSMAVLCIKQEYKNCDTINPNAKD